MTMPNSKATVTEISLPSDPGYLVRLRRIIGCLADGAGMNASEIDDTKLAVTEACANAIRHGSPAGPTDKITVRVSSAGGAVITEVTDQGCGFEPAEICPRVEAEPGGLGIPLMKALSDQVEFEKSGLGTTVRLVKLAKRPRARRRRNLRR